MTSGDSTIASDSPATRATAFARVRDWSVRRVSSSSGSAEAVHYATLVAGFAILIWLTRTQWFFFDEWAFMWEPQRELWAGHGGHWSTVAIALWMGIQSLFTLDSYRPFMLVAIVVHLVTVHLLWRLMRRIGVGPWIATAIAALLIILGAASENLLWAFQYAFMGAIACGLAATLLALGPRLGIGTQFAIAGVMVLGCATSGTLLPFFLPVALVLLRLHGWRALLLPVVVPAAIYLVWYVFVAGPNPNASLRAEGIEVLFTPQFAGAMLADSIGKILPVPAIGALGISAIGAGALWMLRRRLTIEQFTAIAVLGAGLVFAFLSAYSRWDTGLVAASSGRYVYMMFVTLAPITALLLTRAVARSMPATLVALGVIAVVGVYNTGVLVSAAREEGAREEFVHQAASAGLDMQERYPDQVDGRRSPEPQYLPIVDLDSLRVLTEREGLTRIPYGRPAWLTALVNVGLTVEQTAQRAACEPLGIGDRIPSGAVVDAEGGVTVEVAAGDADGTLGHERSLALDHGPNAITTVEDTPLIVSAIEGTAELCSIQAGTRQ